MNKKEYLSEINQVINSGAYKDNWPSLTQHNTPAWYRNAKFGIFVVWGIYTVPGHFDEWYARHMYLKGSDVYKHHIKTYGTPDKFGYKDFVPMFKGEKFNPKEWAKLFKDSGAKYVQPIAVFHDGFPMYDSDLKAFNCKNNGPKVDFLGEMKSAIEKEEMQFCASSHLAENYWFFNGGREFNSDVQDPQNAYLYGPAALSDEVLESDDLTKHRIRTSGPDIEFLEDWLTQTCEFVDKYQPKVVFFDWWIQNLAFKPYLKKFAAYYYNRATEWGEEVTITYKHHAFAYDCATYDVERGQLSGISPRFWQSDTSIARNSWCYTENNDFKSAQDIICDLIDIVSKNGCMLLNVGPKEDGTICEEEKIILENIGKWMSVNGEGIYDTTYWHIFGEGPTEVIEGYFTDYIRKPFTSKDIRYTYKEGYAYAFILKVPEDNNVCLKSFAFPNTGDELEIGKISLLSYSQDIMYTRDNKGLYMKLPDNISKEYPICFKIEMV